MGWASASEIFDTVADGLLEADATDEVLTKVLGRLCDSLRDNDWDTEDESLDRYADNPVIVAMFADRGITRDPEDDDG